jgi:hypothetical protein
MEPGLVLDDGRWTAMAVIADVTHPLMLSRLAAPGQPVTVTEPFSRPGESGRDRGYAASAGTHPAGRFAPPQAGRFLPPAASLVA